MKTVCTVSFSVIQNAGDPYGNRTHIFAVRGRRLDRLTKGPTFADFNIIAHLPEKCKGFLKKSFGKQKIFFGTTQNQVKSGQIHRFYQGKEETGKLIEKNFSIRERNFGKPLDKRKKIWYNIICSVQPTRAESGTIPQSPQSHKRAWRNWQTR